MLVSILVYLTNERTLNYNVSLVRSLTNLRRIQICYADKCLIHRQKSYFAD